MTEDSHAVQFLFLFYTVFAAIFFVGLVGNSVLILIFVRHKNMRTAPNSYILNIAVADLLTTFNCTLSPFMYVVGHNYPRLCQLSQLSAQTLIYVTAYTLVALSVERYCAIIHPFHKKLSAKKCTLTVIIVIWLLSLTYNFVKMFLLIPQSEGKCEPMFDAKTYILTDIILWYLIPLCVFTYCYTIIAKTLYFGSSSLSTSLSHTSTPQRLCAKKRKTAIAVLILVAMYALFYLPFIGTSITLYFGDNNTQNHRSFIHKILLCVGCLHNSFNPIVLYFLSKSFRGHFNNYLFYNLFKSPLLVEDDNTNPETPNKISVKG